MESSTVEIIDELELEPEEAEEVAKETFAIDSHERAEWLLGKLSDIAAAEERINNNAREMIEKLNKRKSSLLGMFGDQLQEFCEKRRQEPGFKGKTVQFLQGKCNWRSTKTGGVKVADTEAALAYCSENDELVDKCVTVSYRLRTTDYIKVFEETGEMLPGIEIEPLAEVESFYVNGEKFRGPVE